VTDTENVVRRAAEDAVDTRGRRTMWICFGVMLLGLAALGVAYVDSRDTASDQAAAIGQLADQVRSLGATPVVEPPAGQPGARGEPGVGIASVEPAPCAITVRLTDGRQTTAGDLCGRPGRDGRSITGAAPAGCDVLLSWSDATTSRVGPMCGPAGPSGTPGRDGQDGVDGQTPPCLSEPTQCRGADGDKGDQGEPGPACPGGYEPRPAVITAPDGSTYDGVACVDPDSRRERPLLPVGR
jgi:hypothetical protein